MLSIFIAEVSVALTVLLTVAGLVIRNPKGQLRSFSGASLVAAVGFGFGFLLAGEEFYLLSLVAFIALEVAHFRVREGIEAATTTGAVTSA